MFVKWVTNSRKSQLETFCCENAVIFICCTVFKTEIFIGNLRKVINKLFQPQALLDEIRQGEREALSKIGMVSKDGMDAPSSSGNQDQMHNYHSPLKVDIDGLQPQSDMFDCVKIQSNEEKMLSFSPESPSPHQFYLFAGHIATAKSKRVAIVGK